MTTTKRVGAMLVLASLAFVLSALLVTAGSTVAGSAVRARAMPPSEVSEEPVLDCARHGQLARSQYDGKGTAVTALGGLPKRPSTILPREEVCGDPEVGATLSGPPERSAPSADRVAGGCDETTGVSRFPKKLTAVAGKAFDFAGFLSEVKRFGLWTERLSRPKQLGLFDIK